jgi:gluconolactonase
MKTGSWFLAAWLVSTAPALEIKVLADGFIFPEGPAINAKGELIVCDIPAHTLWQVDREKGGKTEWLKLEGEGRPNGAIFDPAGNLWVADCGNKSILKIGPDKKIETMTPSDAHLNGPNDLCFDEKGSVYFTDPMFGKDQDKATQGLYRLAEGKLTLLGALRQPNGIQYRDGFIYVTEGPVGAIWRYDVAKGGELQKWAQVENHGVMDGMQFNRDGNLYSAQYGKGAIVVLNSKGEEIKRLEMPGRGVTNVEFDATGDVMYVTEGDGKQVLAITGFR